MNKSGCLASVLPITTDLIFIWSLLRYNSWSQVGVFSRGYRGTAHIVMRLLNHESLVCLGLALGWLLLSNAFNLAVSWIFHKQISSRIPTVHMVGYPHAESRCLLSSPGFERSPVFSICRLVVYGQSNYNQPWGIRQSSFRRGSFDAIIFMPRYTRDPRLSFNLKVYPDKSVISKCSELVSRKLVQERRVEGAKRLSVMPRLTFL